MIPTAKNTATFKNGITNGVVAGVCAIFATVDEYAGYPVRSVFDPKDLGDYASYPSHECPLCKQGQKIDALVNSFGFSKL